jgi:two-component system, NarL family, nitrate/nitrite response regulator NarL
MAQPHSPRSRVRVAIVDDHVLFAESLELALSVEGYDVRRPDLPDDPGSPGSLLSAVTRLKPLVVLLDLDLGRFGDGVRLIGPLAKAGINVVVVTSSLDRARWGDSIRLGARTVLSKSRPLNDIMATVRRLYQGLPVMDRGSARTCCGTGSASVPSTTPSGSGSSGSPPGRRRCWAT